MKFLSKRNVLLLSTTVFLLALILAGGLFFFKNKQAVEQTFSNALTVKPDSFTELYFQNNEQILTKPLVILNYDAVPYTFSFTVHNLENKDMTYQYSVVTAGESNKEIDKGAVFVKKNESKTVHETVVLPNAILTKTKITVNLINKNQQIFFWVGGQK